jgi:hypothetical protein
MMKSFTGININLERGASSQNFQATNLTDHSSNSHKNPIPTALNLARKCAVPFAAILWYQALSMILQTPCNTTLRLLVALTAANGADMES